MSATARSTRRARRTCTALVAVAALFLLSAPLAAAGSKSFAAKRVAGKTAVFSVAGLSGTDVHKARLRVGGYRARVAPTRVRRAARRGKLRLRLPRRVAKRLRKRGARLSRRTRRWPRLTVVTKPGPTPTGAPVAESLSSFETGNFSEFEGFQVKDGGEMNVTTERAYDGSKSARARWLGGETAAERVWKKTDWNTGNEAWYGMAVYVPADVRYCYWNPLRWDNYSEYQSKGDVGGLTVDQNRIKIMRGTYDSPEEDYIVDGGELPKGRWVWLEVHQVFSTQDGRALSEIYVDGAKRGSSTKANTSGRKISHLRAGQVSVADQCSTPNAVDFDRVSISNRQRGPIG